MPVLAITPPGVPEMIIIGLIFVLLFGAKKLPELGGAIGKSIKSFKQGVEDGNANDPTTDDATAEGGASPVATESTPIAGDKK